MTLLLWAGTAEARQLARGLADRGIDAIGSLAGETKSPEPLAIPTRIGGFGGREGFAEFLEQKGISAILDATHPFATRISHRSAEVARQNGLPYCQVLRPEWVAGPGDDWTHLRDEKEAAQHIPTGTRVLLATGRKSLDRFAQLSDCDLILRVVDPQPEPFPLPNGRYLVARPPFSVASEKALFAELGVDIIVAKNSGGVRAYAKILASREMGIPVLMIDRPEQPDAQKVATVGEALKWVERL